MRQQQQNHHLRTHLKSLVGAGELRAEGLNAFYWHQIFDLDFAVVKPEKSVKLTQRLPYLPNASSRGNNQNYKHTVMIQRKGLSTQR